MTREMMEAEERDAREYAVRNEEDQAKEQHFEEWCKMNNIEFPDDNDEYDEAYEEAWEVFEEDYDWRDYVEDYDY